jgi:Protein of unknown function (DUF4012)
VGGLIGALALVDGAWATNSAVRGLSQVRHQLELAVEDLFAGRVQDAATRFGLARTFADRAAGLTAHPAAAVADVLPLVGDDVDAIQTMARSVSRVADAGSSLVAAARAADWDGTLPGTRVGGSIPIEPIRATTPHLDRATEHLEQAARILAPVRAKELVGPVADAARTVRSAIADRGNLVRAAADATRLLPALLGDEESRRYFLALQNLSAPRGTGGFLGLYGVLEIDRGRLSLGELGHVSTLRRVAPVEAPEDVRARYGRFGGLTHPIAANYSPDFPTSAEVMLAMAEPSLGRLDGVIGADPVWLSDVLRAYGPVETSAWPERLTYRNISAVLQRDSFLLGQAESNRAQEALARAVFEAILERPLPVRGLAAAVAGGTEERHLQIYSRDPDEQALLGELGAAGDVQMPQQPLFVVWQDATSGRAGFFAHRQIRHRVLLREDGSADVETTVTLQNEAPSGPPSILLGYGTSGDPVGYFAAYSNVYLPEEAENISSEVSTGFRLGLVEEEFGRPVALELLGAEAGQSAIMTISYRVADALRRRGTTAEYRLDFLPQPALRPGSVSVEIRLPSGAEVTDVASGLQVTGEVVSFEGSPTVPRSLWVRYA